MFKTSRSKNSESKSRKKFVLKSRQTSCPATSETAGTADIGTAVKSSFVEVSEDEKHTLISKAAYYRSERRSFAPGCELEDWLDAEAEIEKMLSQNRFSTPH
ncbi:MAG TPA: DUF2934 domain-containing protein [Acidobacteriota bacterium]|nr:DUF2934 domain-containing protein [Acidobacteriota bacterium]